MQVMNYFNDNKPYGSNRLLWNLAIPPLDQRHPVYRLNIFFLYTFSSYFLEYRCICNIYQEKTLYEFSEIYKLGISFFYFMQPIYSYDYLWEMLIM